MWQLGWSGGQWVTHREWVASVCLGDFTLFRQALQECPTIRPIGSCSTDLLGRHWLIWRPTVWKHCLCNLLSLCSCLQLSPAVCLSTAQPLWLIPDVHSTVTIKTTLGWLHNGSHSGSRGSGSWKSAMTCRWEMLRFGHIPASQPRICFEETNCLVTLFLRGSGTLYMWLHSLHNLHDLTMHFKYSK